ncbi:MAG TPA: hypothetical protein VHS28_05270 [Chloroflexota bacterium]|nr:hypothetical protein [Chloroflexota bacterium]
MNSDGTMPPAKCPKIASDAAAAGIVVAVGGVRVVSGVGVAVLGTVGVPVAVDVGTAVAV